MGVGDEGGGKGVWVTSYGVLVKSAWIRARG